MKIIKQKSKLVKISYSSTRNTYHRCFRFWKNKCCNKPKYIKQRKQTCLKQFKNYKVLIKCSYSLNDICPIIDDYDPNKKLKILNVLNDITADVLSNKKLEPTVTEMFICIKYFTCFDYTIILCCSRIC